MKFRHAMSLITPMAHDHPINASVIATLSNIFILEMILGGVLFGQHSVLHQMENPRVLMF